jgi:hypothetical protein
MPHRKKLNILNNPPAEAPPAVLRLKRLEPDGFAVDRGGGDERWTPQQLFEYLVAQGYSRDDAESTVAQARIASEIHISLPSVH